MSREQLDSLDLAISALRETVDELTRFCDILERFIQIIEQAEERDILERFL